MNRPDRLCLLALLGVLLASCGSTPPREAQVGEEDRTQVARFDRLFNVREGLYDLVLVTRDFREELELLEHTTVLAYRGGKYSSLDVVTFDRKVLGESRVRHRLAGLWPVDLRSDPTNRSLLLAEATGEFFTEVEEDAGEKASMQPAGIESLEVTISFVHLEKDGDLVIKAPETGEVGRAIALALGASGEADLPFHWKMLLEFHVAERNRINGKTVEAARAFQRVVDTVEHTRAGPDGDAYDRSPYHLKNIDYIHDMANKRLVELK